MEPNTQPRTTTAFYVQSVAAFALSLLAVCTGIVYLPVGGWIRAFLGLGLLFVVSSAFSLAKCVRDLQEGSTVVRRIDQARIDKLLADHDPFKMPA